MTLENHAFPETVAAPNTAQQFSDAARLYSEDVQMQFRTHRFAIIPEVISSEFCATLIGSLHFSRFIPVDIKQSFEISRFYTKNGESLAKTCPDLVFFENCILEWVNHITGEQFERLDNRSIGFSLNVTPAGGGLGTHHDRHEISVISYLNDVNGGGELYLYPPFPTIFGRQLHRHAIKLLSSSRNRFFSLLHRLIFRPRRVVPRAGTVVLLTKASQHRVDPVHAGVVRFSFVLGFDRAGISFKDDPIYYGYGEETVVLSDVLASATPN